ncbi:uncharacterized protein LOC108837046 [Raphanus sativus]|uniref:Uncharacterized protein LOC108837046 n=1 Tax=Raphanus sativus TaxID=3726 RepID=A0A9W3DK12_RAPSA|nr:uncharacterized protein LOC108837046 [Raphanus sativus]
MLKSYLTLLVKAASDLVEKGMEQFLVRGLANLEKFLEREKSLYNYNKDQWDFVSCFLSKIKDLGPLTKEATGKIHRLVKSTPSLVQQPHEHGAGSEHEWSDRSAATDLVDKGMEPFLVRGLADVEKFLEREKGLYNYNKDQCDFVSCFLSKIEDLGPLTMEATGKIHRSVKSTPSVVQQPQEHGAGSEREWSDRLNNLQPLEILRVFASTDVEEREEESTDASLLRELQPLLISCLWEKERISESMFKVLSEVVYSIAETDFQRAVYIFQCLTMWLHEEFMDPIVEHLLPKINKRLNPPSDVLVDNSCWVLSFLGAFCVIIQLVAMKFYAGTVMEMADNMVDSVTELVERKMEVGLRGELSEIWKSL